MKKAIILLFLALFFLAGTCRKEGEDCHRKITIINTSNQNIIQALCGHEPSGKCILSGSTITPNDIYEFRINECWEGRLANGQPQEIYIVDPNHYNPPEVFYDCDSIEIKNTILKHYVLYLEDLKKNNFTVTYP